jgi:hypothetical protein
MSHRSSRVRSFTAPVFGSVVTACAAILLFSATGCSLGQGNGDVKSDMLFASECWGSSDAGANGQPQGDPYDLKPDFFAAIPYRNAMLIRVQRGNDLQEVSDGIAVLIDDVARVRAALKNPPAGGAPIGSPVACAPTPADIGGHGRGAGSGDGGAGSADDCPPGTVGFPVAIPVGVVPPGSPTVPPQDLIDAPPIVHLSLYLQRSCHNANAMLHAVSGKVCFATLFSGDRNETNADQKLTDVQSFSVQVGDLRDVPVGKNPREIPCARQSTLRGSFRFYFERGQPGQPFP